jgi:hypothetical protein
VVTFVTAEDCDAIHVAHSLSLYPADYNDACALDVLLVGLIGDDPASIFLVAFSQAFMDHCTMTTIHDVATLQGVTLHGATPPLFQSGPHGMGDTSTNDIQAHHAMILPFDLAGCQRY